MKVLIPSIYFLLYFSILSGTGFSQNYSVERIKDELKKNAGSVVRTNEIVFTVKSRSKAILEQKYAITILHKSHRQNSIFREVYDQFSKISLISISIYDKYGKKVKRVKNSDILDLSTFSQSALFADIRQKLYNPEYYEYPFTIEWSYTKTINGILSYPSFYAITSYDMSLERGEFVVNIPTQLRYVQENYDTEPIITKIDDVNNEYKWEFKNIKSIISEDYDLRFAELIPKVKLAPSQFEMEGYVGDASSWEGFGSWIYSLNNGRSDLSSETKNEILKLTSGAADSKEKIKLVYEYLQSKTRYVNVVIGIGGWQPFTAMEVDENGYGDCKALSNFTYSLLKAIDIESYYTIIKAGDNVEEIRKIFPSNQFNHAILCVPNGNDTIWLECTSQRNPFGYMGSFTEGREALLIKENDSKLVMIPSLSNFRLRKAIILFNENGDVHAEIEKKHQGLYYDNKRGSYYLEGKRRMDRIRNNIHIKNYSINDEDYKITEYRSDYPYFIEDCFVTANSYIKKIGERLLFDINFFNTEINVPSAINKQESNIFINHSATKIDSLEFIIPDGYFVKSFPENDSLVSEFGEFYTWFELEGNSLHYTRKQIVKKGTYSADKYNSLRAYLKEISKADRAKVLVMPKE